MCPLREISVCHSVAREAAGNVPWLAAEIVGRKEIFTFEKVFNT
jgi:hypothetical protein